MLRTLVKFLALAIAGPAIAFLVLFTGCEEPEPFFGVMCGHNILTSLAAFTLVAWLILATGKAVVQALRNKE